MSDGIGIISKGLVLKAIEKVTRERRADFRNVLNNPSTTPGSDWITFLAQHGGLDPNAEDYFRTAWLATFWSPRYPVEAIVRRGLIEAIELANQQGGSLPIDGYWIWTHDARPGNPVPAFLGAIAALTPWVETANMRLKGAFIAARILAVVEVIGYRLAPCWGSR